MKLTLMRSVGLAFAAWPSAYGQFENFTFNNYGNDKLAPWGVNLTSFDANLAAPNATGRYPLPGPNISAPYGSPPGYMIIDGWAWNIAVTADIPLSLANHTSPGNQDQVFTGTTLQLVIPDSLLTGAPGSINAVVDESWRMCIMRWALPDDYNDSLRTDDGSCTSIMSNQCIKDIQNYTAYTYKSSASCKCPDLGKILPSCSGNGLPGGCAASSFEASEIRQWPNGTLNELRFGGNPHEKGDIAAYNLTGIRYRKRAPIVADDSTQSVMCNG
ncbi:hypothetical protein GQ53DRAFT_864141 [Thozetella sp. PMI_491]|nr:hypothetical protein GQ53DRAFT_864141 [Thozetella sp. PMI_491]